MQHDADSENLVGYLEGIAGPVLVLMLVQKLKLLGSAIAVCSRRQAFIRQVFGEGIGRAAKIDDDRRTVALPDQDVEQLQVPMQYAPTVHVRQRTRELFKDAQDFADRRVLTLGPLRERPSFHVIKRKVRVAGLRVAMPLRPYNVGMIQHEKRRQLTQRSCMGLLRVATRLPVPRYLERIALAVLFSEEDEGKATVAEFLGNLPSVNERGGRRPCRRCRHWVPPVPGFGKRTSGIVKSRPPSPRNSTVKTRPASDS
ncbi:hypothetical protein COEX109129_40705 [Corallococcus exiguus]